MGKLLNCETWGCELFPYRAEKAASRLDKCHSAVWESCSLTDESVTLLWLNPPYDDDRHGNEKRLDKLVSPLGSLRIASPSNHSD